MRVSPTAPAGGPVTAAPPLVVPCRAAGSLCEGNARCGAFRGPSGSAGKARGGGGGGGGACAPACTDSCSERADNARAGSTPATHLLVHRHGTFLCRACPAQEASAGGSAAAGRAHACARMPCFHRQFSGTHPCARPLLLPPTWHLCLRHHPVRLVCSRHVGEAALCLRLMQYGSGVGRVVAGAGAAVLQFGTPQRAGRGHGGHVHRQVAHPQPFPALTSTAPAPPPWGRPVASFRCTASAPLDHCQRPPRRGHVESSLPGAAGPRRECSRNEFSLVTCTPAQAAGRGGPAAGVRRRTAPLPPSGRLPCAAAQRLPCWDLRVCCIWAATGARCRRAAPPPLLVSFSP